MDAVIALAARHQRRDHHLRSHVKLLAHEVFLEFRADLDQHAADLVAERERPRQRLRPMSFQDMQIGAADTAGADLDQRGLFRDFRPGHLADHRLCARTGIGAYADLFHRVSSCALRSLIELFGVGKSLSEAADEANAEIVWLRSAGPVDARGLLSRLDRDRRCRDQATAVSAARMAAPFGEPRPVQAFQPGPGPAV